MTEWKTEEEIDPKRREPLTKAEKARRQRAAREFFKKQVAELWGKPTEEEA